MPSLIYSDRSGEIVFKPVVGNDPNVTRRIDAWIVSETEMVVTLLSSIANVVHPNQESSYG